MAQQNHPRNQAPLLEDARDAKALPDDFEIEAAMELTKLWAEVFGSLHVRMEEALPEIRRRARTDGAAQRLGRVFVELTSPETGKVNSRSAGWLLRRLSRFSYAGLYLHRDKDRGWSVRRLPRE